VEAAGVYGEFEDVELVGWVGWGCVGGGREESDVLADTPWRIYNLYENAPS